MIPLCLQLLVTKRFRVVRKSWTGGDGRRHQREIVQHPGAVTILPMVDEHHVCLIRNARVAVGKVLIELPAGTLEAGEDPALAARRELAEETGYLAESLAPLRQFYLSPGILDERMHVFVATGLTPGPAALEPGEDIEPFVISWQEAMAMVHDGRIEDAKTLVALLDYERLRGAT